MLVFEQRPLELPRHRDPTAWRALAFALLLGMPATLCMVLLLLLESVARSMCEPDETCGALPSGAIFTGWLVGGIGFVVSAISAGCLNRFHQRGARWFCALMAVGLPVLVIVVAFSAGQR
jgi:hypothetical protein